jgi:NPCBM/NEW2 domain
MGKWWRARSWEQKLGLITLLVTILGSLVVPFYLDQRDGGDAQPAPPATTGAAALPTTTGAPPVTESSVTDPTVAEAAAPLTPDGKVLRYLSDMDRVEGNSPNRGSFIVNGVPHAHSIAHTQYGSSTATEYDLGRAFETFETTIGLRDDSSATGSAKFEVFLDGRSTTARTVAFGRAVDLRVPVTGVLRLRLVVTPLNPESPRIYSTWGDARLLGDPSKVPPTT